MNPEIEELEDILDAILAGVQEILASGETISPEFQQQIADEINYLTQEIDTLYTSEAAEPGQETSGKVPSINAPVPPGAQLLWVLSGSNPDAFISYMAQIPDPDLNSLLRQPDRLTDIINQLQAQIPKDPREMEGGIRHADLNSSNIWGARQLRNGKTQVRFQGGAVYEYDGIPPQIFKAFMMGAVPAKTKGQNQYGAWWKGKQPSLGASFYELIKQGGFNYRRLR